MDVRTPPIADLVPQSGAMVLLDRIVTHDGRRLACRASSHRNAGHPLASGGVLPVWAGVEYAAQAMAAHFALASAGGAKGAIGLLGALRDVRASVVRLDDDEGELSIVVERLSHDASGSIYAFSVSAAGATAALIEGRATVVHRER